MRKKISIIIISTMLSILIMSGGYGLWSEKLTITGRIIVEEPTLKQTEVQTQKLDNKEVLELDSNQESLKQNINQPTDPAVQVDKRQDTKEEENNLGEENKLDQKNEVDPILEEEVIDDKDGNSANALSQQK